MGVLSTWFSWIMSSAKAVGPSSDKSKKKKKNFGRVKTDVQVSNIKQAKRNLKKSVLSGGAAGMSLMGTGGSKRADWERIALNLALPGANNPTRWSSAFSDLPTAVAAPWTIFDAPWSGSASPPNGQMYYTDMVMFVFREAERSVVVYNANAGGSLFTYELQGSVPTSTFPLTAPSGSWVMPLAMFAVPPNQNIYLHTPYALSSQTFSPHGSTVFAGAAEGSKGRYFWIDSGSTVTLSLTSAATGVFILKGDLWTPDGVEENALVSGNITLSSGGPTATGTISVSNSGYYCFSVVIASGTPASGGLLVNYLHWACSGSTFAHLCMPDYEKNVTSIEGLRINAVSAMYTNKASDLNRQGEIAGYQAPQSSHWTDFVTGTLSSSFSLVSKSQGACTLSADNGMYGFLKPTQPEDFDILSYVDSTAGIVTDSYYPLDHHSSFLVLFAQVTNVAGGQDGYFTVAYGVEYQTRDVWRKVSPPEFDRRVYESALDYLKVLPQWHENPLHIAEIWDTIKKGTKRVAEFAQQYGPLAISAAKGLASFL